MKKYTIVSFHNLPSKLTFRHNDWPLHLTILGSFYTVETPSALSKLIFKSSKKFHRLEIPVKAKTMFGPNKDIAVTELVRIDKLYNMHMSLFASLESLITLSRPYINIQNYRPHVTDQGKDNHREDELFHLNTISLLELTEELVIIHSTVKLSN